MQQLSIHLLQLTSIGLYQQREQFRKKILDRAARRKSPPLKILEGISEVGDGEGESEDSESEGEASSAGYSTVTIQGAWCYCALL